MTWLYDVLIFFGMNQTWATTIASWSLSGSISVIVVLALLKFLIIPLLSKTLGVAVEKYLTRGEEIVNSLKETIEKQTEIANDIVVIKSRQDKVLDMIEEILGESIGNTDDLLAISTFSQFMNSIHLRLYIFYNRRVEKNHILAHPEVVFGRYSAKADELLGKTNSQLSKYYYKGNPLSMFWGNGGIESFFRHISNELYNLQLLKAQGDSFVCGLNDEDIENAFDRLLSKLMSSFKLWIDTGKDYQSTKHLYCMNLFTNEEVNGEVENL